MRGRRSRPATSPDRNETIGNAPPPPPRPQQRRCLCGAVRRARRDRLRGPPPPRQQRREPPDPERSDHAGQDRPAPDHGVGAGVGGGQREREGTCGRRGPSAVPRTGSRLTRAVPRDVEDDVVRPLRGRRRRVADAAVQLTHPDSRLHRSSPSPEVQARRLRHVRTQGPTRRPCRSGLRCCAEDRFGRACPWATICSSRWPVRSARSACGPSRQPAPVLVRRRTGFRDFGFPDGNDVDFCIDLGTRVVRAEQGLQRGPELQDPAGAQGRDGEYGEWLDGRPGPDRAWPVRFTPAECRCLSTPWRIRAAIASDIVYPGGSSAITVDSNCCGGMDYGSQITKSLCGHWFGSSHV